MEVFGSSGVRGIVNDDLTPAFVLRVAAAAATVWEADRVAIGRDTRRSGSMLADAAASGIASTGADVDRLGIIPTPGVQHYATTEGVPALVITASHNPPAYNGVKLVGADGIELAVPALERVEGALEAGSDTADWHAVGRQTRVEGAREAYRQASLGAIDRDRIAAADLTVAVDPGHGAGALVSPQVFRALGCRVTTVHGQPDGTFPGRDPEPVASNLDALADLVVAADADLGIAHDGDADRAIFVDETGRHVEGDAALAALAAAVLEPGDATVTAVNVSQRLVDVVEATDAILELTPIGSSNIVTRIQALQEEERRVPIAGEGNGGIFFPEHRLARDGTYAAARLLELVAETPASELLEPYAGYANVRRKFTYESTGEREAMLGAVAALAERTDAEVTTIDGHRFDHGDAWVLARPSGTEPVIRVYAEAPDPVRAETLADEVADVMLAAVSPD